VIEEELRAPGGEFELVRVTALQRTE